MVQPSPLKQIAEIVGVSKMTVSRALREGTSVTPVLREKIRETAQKLGYQPDSLISQAMRAVRKAQSTGYRETLAFAWPDRAAHKVHAPGVADEIFEGARRRAQDLGYRLDEFHLPEIPRTAEALSSILNARSIRGLLVGPGTAAEAGLGQVLLRALGTNLCQPGVAARAARPLSGLRPGHAPAQPSSLPAHRPRLVDGG
jgi:DNA-binding LacI/PurR family transcriptional regulator